MKELARKTILHNEDHLVLNKQKKREPKRMQSAIGEKPYKCTVSRCRRRFGRYNNMIQHTKTYHGINSTTTAIEPVPPLVKSRKRKQPTNSSKRKRQQQEEHVAMLMNELFLLSDSSQLTSDEEVEYDDDEKQRHMMILPHLASYLLNHPNEPPESYLKSISVQESLCPMESLLMLKQRPLFEERREAYYYLTVDEFEALEGLTQFYKYNKYHSLFT